MRYSQGHREETRRRIVETASRLFQEKGMERVGVDEIMREIGLTHGGFYVHFENKEQLIAEACAYTVEQNLREWERCICGMEPNAAFEAFLDGHLKQAEEANCPLGMLGGDVARSSEAVRNAYTAKVRELVDFMTEEFGCNRDEAVLAFTAVIGATTVARASGDEAFAEEILDATRRELLRLQKERCAPAKRKRAAG